MSRAVVAMGVGILVAGGAAFYAQNLANQALQREVAGLREVVRQAMTAAKAAAVEAPRSQAATGSSEPAAVMVREGENQDLVKLREEIVALRKSTQEITRFAQMAQAAQAAKSLEKSSESIATNLVPAGAMKNAGRATPEASTETALWAAVGGDVDALSKTLMFTASARSKADDWFAGLSAGTKQQYGSPENVIALMIAKDAESLSGMQVLGRQEISPDNVGVRLRIAGADGKTKDDTFLMHRSADGWKMVLPDAAVEKYARLLSRGK